MLQIKVRCVDKLALINSDRPLRLSAIIAILTTGYSLFAFADTAIETEAAQIGKQGEIGISQSYEYAKAKDGKSGGTLTQFEYGLSDRAEILIEPFFYVWEHPDGESKVDGLGDLEITPSYEFVTEDNGMPAMLAAFKLKVPTGSKDAGGSGKFDYMPYIILGQHYAGWTFNVNLGVNIVTPTDGGKYEKVATWAVETEREIMPNLTLLLEAFSTEDNVNTISTALEYQVSKDFNVFGAAGYTEENEAILRAGFNLDF